MRMTCIPCITTHFSVVAAMTEVASVAVGQAIQLSPPDIRDHVLISVVVCEPKISGPSNVADAQADDGRPATT